MKKIFIFLSMTLIATTSLFAQAYKQSIGAVVGGLNGVSYKYFVKENVAIQADLGVGLTYATGVLHLDHVGWALEGEASLMSLQVQPNAYYQNTITSGNWGTLAYQVGGGITIGCAQDIDAVDYKGFKDCYFKWGVNAFAGIEYIMSNTPITIGLDFRPGFAMNTYKNDFEAVHMNLFDWVLAGSVRYTF